MLFFCMVSQKKKNEKNQVFSKSGNVNISCCFEFELISFGHSTENFMESTSMELSL